MFRVGPPLIVSGMLESVSCCKSTEWTHLTVGAQTGTSLRMIERAYYKLIPSVMREKLAAVEATLPVD